jgi:LmbE family N-acetylglucosaminyl deacetylase
MRKILVISPHPDDEILGCGATLSKFKNKSINWIIVTKMSKSSGYSKKQIINREKEIKLISKKLKIKKTFNLNFDTGTLHKGNLGQLIKNISTILKKVRPDTIFCPFINDSHSDHFFIAHSINSILKVFRHPYIKLVLMYETLSETNFNYVKKNFKPNYYIDISKHLKNKIALMRIYKSEFKKHPFPRSIKSVKALAEIRGSESGYNYAESFKLIFSRSEN